MIWTNPAEMALNELTQQPLVRFSALALSSVFFLVDPFAAIGSFLAITEGANAARRKRMARKGALTCFIVLTSFAVGGQLIFRLLGITLPAFEIAGGLILLLIGLDMLEAKRRRRPWAIQRRPRTRRTPGLCRWGFPCWPGQARFRR
jgi:multiple antibiotic resistance protein